jgi:peptidoglycan/xylan/chitin deacetylase (PgdA/CDA1 family)
MKRSIQSVIRRVHVKLARRLPERLGIYFHSLPAEDWSAFRSMVDLFRVAGYRFVNADELSNGTNGKMAFLSFDDNHRSWYEALALFDNTDVSVTFYVNTLPLRDRAEAEDVRAYYSRIDEDPDASTPLSSDDVAQLAERGHTIGAHTHSHFVLSHLSEADARREIDTSRDLLSEIVSAPVVHFAYPFGMRRHFTEELRAYCMTNGFRTVANAIPGMQFAGHRPQAIQRTSWNLRMPNEHNIENLRIDGRLFERLTGRTAVPF